jgi:PiT family inorganic phosphate transporter
MGVIAATLGASGYLVADSSGKYLPPTWVIFAAAAMISIGTYWGGWAIIDTMGLKITRITRATGLGANIGATTAIFGATGAGIPISTTHAAASSVMGSGVGARRRVNWSVMRDMAAAWVVTLPAVAVLAFGFYLVTTLPQPTAPIVAGLIVLAVAVAAVQLMRRAPGASDMARKLEQHESLPVADAMPIVAEPEPEPEPAPGRSGSS